MPVRPNDQHETDLGGSPREDVGSDYAFGHPLCTVDRLLRIFHRQHVTPWALTLRSEVLESRKAGLAKPPFF